MDAYEIRFVPRSEFERIGALPLDEGRRLSLVADMARLNALSAVKMAGSGHLGSSFSSLDIVVYLYFRELNVREVGMDSPDRDIFFSSKGHDCPGTYAVLAAAGFLPEESLGTLRRLNGLDGHPDVRIPGVEANSGSLGMGISKAKGMALAKRMGGHSGRVIVMTGDGELQEGQVWESLQTTVQQRITNVYAIVDANKIQSDRPVADIVDLGDLVGKFESFGWHVERCDGHDYTALEHAFRSMDAVADKPKVLIADTIKGKGIACMEGPRALRDGGGLYRWHSGAPDDEAYEAGRDELSARIDERLAEVEVSQLHLVVAEVRDKGRVRLKDSAEKVVTAFGEALVEIGEQHPEVVVLDADLSADCGLRPFEERFPERFIECGIAEQDMVSTAGGLALGGYLPVVNSFGAFLASRANEQIYNNASELTKVVYVNHYAGLIPAGPGKSHQSLRDVSLVGALPNMIVVEPCNAVETRDALGWCVSEAEESCVLRLIISASPRTISLPHEYRLELGKGTVLRDGVDAVVLGYGPVLLNEALTASERLAEEGFGLKVVDMPWLNRIDAAWLGNVIDGFSEVFVLDDHSPYGGLGDLVCGALGGEAVAWRPTRRLAVEGWPACGTPHEALQAHGLDAESLVQRIAGRE